MRDTLPPKIKNNECGIINLDISSSSGIHWTAYIKKSTSIAYYDTYGHLLPNELITYFHSDGNINNIKYNYNGEQKYNSYNCGQLCLKFLYKLNL